MFWKRLWFVNLKVSLFFKINLIYLCSLSQFDSAEVVELGVNNFWDLLIEDLGL